MKRLHDLGFALAFNAVLLWLYSPMLQAAAAQLSDPPPSVPVLGEDDPYTFVEEFWSDVVGVEFVPGGSGMALWQELPRDEWIVAVADMTRKHDIGVALLTYTEQARFSLPESLFPPEVVSSGLSVGTMVGFDGREHIVLAMVAEIQTLLVDGADGPRVARPFAPMTVYDDLIFAVEAAGEAAEFFQSIANGDPHQQGASPREPLAPQDQVQPNSTSKRPVPNFKPMLAPPPPPPCAAIYAAQVAACNLEFRAELILALGGFGTCVAGLCKGLAAGCTPFGFVLGATACYILCVSACWLGMAIIVAAFAHIRAACIQRAIAARIACQPGWTPPMVKWWAF